MTHDIRNKPQDSNPNAARHALSARRRLIQGSFAAPVALTLCSGSAFAAGSLTGVQIQLATPQYPINSTTAPGTGSAGTWLRVQVYIKSGNRFVKGTEINNLLLTRPASASDFVSGLNYQLVSPFAGLSDADAGNPRAINEYAAVRVNIVSGVVKIVGIVGINGSTGTALGQSAWTSFA